VSPNDPIGELAHDHADLNRQVLELGAIIVGPIAPIEHALVERLTELREQLFLHFAREEEGLFPFVAEHIPELADQVNTMAMTHDTICGVVARMCYMATVSAEPSALRPFFERFEQAYASHAKVEAELLRGLEGRLDGAQRAQLAALVRDL
jgi:iron-sulfur cluster repair protein YtfE (RIC family)